MAKKDIFRLFPEVLRTSTQKKFFDATIEQLFSTSDRTSMNGFIGRRDGGFYDPLKDYYLPQKNYERMWNLLEPITLSRDIDGTSNEVFLSDLLNQIDFLGGNTKNQDRLFKSEFYSFAPPINIDKFINYSSYQWKPDVVGLELDIYDLTDDEIEYYILGKKNYTHVSGIVFMNDLLVKFSKSSSYNADIFQVVGVGTEEGISLVKRYNPNPGQEISDIIAQEAQQDYITIEVGARNENEWSKNNFWFHKDTLAYMASIKQNEDGYFEGNKQARRPIISFDKNLELFGMGTEKPEWVTYAVTDSFSTITETNATKTFPFGVNGIPVTLRGELSNVVTKKDTLVHLGDNVDINYDTKESFVGRYTGYRFIPKLSFEQDATVFCVVSRPVTMGYIQYAALIALMPVNGESFSDAFSSAFGTIEELFTGVAVGDLYDFTAVSPFNGGLPIPILKDENLYLDELYDDNGFITKDAYTVISVTSGIIRVQMNIPHVGDLKAKLGVIVGQNTVINPDWYNIDAQDNSVNFKVDIFVNEDEYHTLSQVGVTTEYTIVMANITDPETVTVYIDGDKLPPTDYSWSNSGTLLSVILDNPTTGTVTARVTDGVSGIKDGQFISEAEFDTIDVYINADVEKLTPQVAGTANLFSFVTTIDDLTMDNIVAVKVTDKNEEDVAYNNVIIDEVYITGSTINVRLSNDAASPTDLVVVYVRNTKNISVQYNDYIWEVNSRDTINFKTRPSYEVQNILLPIRGLPNFSRDGDVSIIEDGIYKNTHFYFYDDVWSGDKWNKQLTSTGDANHRYSANTPPKFELYYSNLVQGKASRISSMSEGFFGSEIFSYKINTNGVINDPFIGIPLTYKNVGVNAEIVFEHDLELDRAYDTSGLTPVEIPGYYYFKKVDNDRNVSYDYTWAKTSEKTKLRINDRFTYIAEDIFTEVLTPNNLTVLRFDPSVTPVQMGDLYDVVLYVNGDKKEQGEEIVLDGNISSVPHDYHYDSINNQFVYYSFQGVKEYDVFEFKILSDDGIDRNSYAYYEQPMQLESNAENKEIVNVTISDLTPHFRTIMENQDGFEGDALGSKNNYRDTMKDISRGTVIVQTSAPLLKAMISSSEDYLGIVESLKFSKLEYIRFKDKLVKFAQQLYRESFNPDSFVYPNASENEIILNEIITRIVNSTNYNGAFESSKMLPWGLDYLEEEFVATAVDHIISSDTDLLDPSTMISVYVKDTGELLLKNIDYTITSSNTIMVSSTHISEDILLKIYGDKNPAKVPSTPTKCGMAPLYVPAIIMDYSYVTPMYVIVGHDGSKTKAYSHPDDIMSGLEYRLDLRDRVLLDFEKRIYNNVSDSLQKAENDVMPIYEFIAGYSRETPYSNQEIRSIFYPEFNRWAYKINANYESNETCDVLNWKTWNYSAVNPTLPGNWKGIYLYLYDTTTPNTTPWEMLGFSIKPEWWDAYYPVVGNYKNDNSSEMNLMWNDIKNGYIRDGDRKGVDSNFIRPHIADGNGFLKPPVDVSGNIIPPHNILHLNINEPTDSQKSVNWKYGDMSPVEYAWYTSSEYFYVLLEKIFLMAPNRFCEFLWDKTTIARAGISPSQVVSSKTLKRTQNSDLSVHGEATSNHWGYQHFVSDYMKYLGVDVKEMFGDVIRNTTVRLAHRIAGFTNKTGLRALLEGSSINSKNVGLVIPESSYDVKVHVGNIVGSYTYSGLMVRCSEDGYEVFGYDYTNPTFKYYGRSSYGTPRQIDVGGKPSPFRVFKSGETYSVGSYVKKDDKFYQSLANQTVTKFEDGSWRKLAALPTTGGKTVSYIKEYDTSVEYTIDYNTVFTDDQSLFDFIVGYGDWLTEQGWRFDNVNEATGILQSWLESAKQVLFWMTNNWGVGNTIQVSAGAEQINFDSQNGYPNNIGKTSNGIYSVMDVSGNPILPQDLFVQRDGASISVSHNDEARGVYFTKITTSETEHIIIFENQTDFNDVIYDPLFNSRTRRIQLRGVKSSGWIGKYEADGFIISDTQMIGNFENVVESTRKYYEVDYTVDNPTIESAARHLIGFENKNYFNQLGIYDDAQYQFYKGMLPEKGTVMPFEKLMRSSKLIGENSFTIYENWAFKMGEFGNTSNESMLEVVIDGDNIKSDPQIVKLIYGNETAVDKTIYAVNIITATHVYRNQPVIKAVKIVNDAVVFYETEIRFTVSLDRFKRISSIEVVGDDIFSETPVLYVYDVPSSINTNDVTVMGAYVTVDDIAANMKEISYVGITTNKDIYVDINDNEKWISDNKSRAKSKGGIFPTISDASPRRVTKDAGYVHLDDVTMTAFYLDDMYSITETYTGSLVSAYIWVADVGGNNNREWDVFLLSQEFELNSIAGKIVIDKQVFDYYPADAGSIADIDYVINSAGEEKVNGTGIGEMDLVGGDFEILVYSSRRFSESSLIDPADTNIAWADYDSTFGGWCALKEGQVLRNYSEMINSYYFSDSYVYDFNTYATLNHIQIFDPYKGIIPVVADRNLKYISDKDPSRYTNSDDTQMINENMAFGKQNVGELWWDTTRCKYILYEQGTDDYRKNKWGTMFPGSNVDVYEWVESDVPPADYVGEGTPKNTTDYVISEQYDPYYEKHTVIYYFWAKDVTTKPFNLPNRNLSAKNVARMLSNPRTQGYAWYAVISPTAFIFNNVNSSLNQRDNVFSINYKFTESDIRKHVEWKLIAADNPEDEIPQFLLNKLVDSLSTYDSKGNVVPNPILYGNKKYGIMETPRQTMFVDIYDARKIMMESLNSLLSTIRLRDESEWINDDPLTAAIIACDYDIWTWADWFEEGYTAENTTPSIIINDDSVEPFRTVPNKPTLTSSQKEKLIDGDVVQVFSPGNSIYFKYDAELEVLTDVVRREKTALYILEDVYAERKIKCVDDNIRILLETILNKVFTLLADGDFSVYKNKFFFSMVNYVASTQPYVDWFFKTTYVDVVQDSKSIDTTSKYFNTNKFGGIPDFINEIKPYQVKIKDIVESFSSVLEGALLLGGDFDSYSYETTIDGETVPVTNPKYNPNDLPRNITIENLYDAIQCGYRDKDIFVETGGQEKTISESSDRFSMEFCIAPANFDILVNGVLMSGTDYISEVLPGNRLKLNFNQPLNIGDVVFVDEYILTNGVSNVYTFKTNPQIDRISFTTIAVGELGDDIAMTFSLTRDNGFTVENDGQYFNQVHVTIDNTIEIPANTKLRAYGGIHFTHTATEEMRLSFFGKNMGTGDELDPSGIMDVKVVEFDILVDANGNFFTGFGIHPWGEIEWDSNKAVVIPATVKPEYVGWDSLTNSWDSGVWNMGGTSSGINGFHNDIRKGKFVISSGAAGRFVHRYSDIDTSNIKGGISGEVIKYSEYSEKMISTTTAEQELLEVISSQFSTAFKCGFDGAIIDAQDFMYQNTDRWDTEAWDSGNFDGERLMPFVTPVIGAIASLSYTTNGIINYFIIDALVSVEGVTLNGAIVDTGDYVVTQDILDKTTIVTLTNTPAALDVIEVFFNKINNAMKFAGTGASVYDIPYRANVYSITVNGTEISYGYDYNVSLGLVETTVSFSSPITNTDNVVIWHKKLFDIGFTGNGLNDTFTIINAEAIGEVTVNGVVQVEGTDYTVSLNVNPNLSMINDLVVTFAVPPALSLPIRISYVMATVLFDNDISKQVIDGGDFIKTAVSEGVTDELAPFTTSDAMVLTYTDLSESISAENIRIFVSDVEKQATHTLINRTQLSQAFDINDNEMSVMDASIFGNATITSPKTVWVGSEKIMYTEKVGNVLRGLKRMTSGTSIDTQIANIYNGETTYPIGAYVYSETNTVLDPISYTPNTPGFIPPVWDGISLELRSSTTLPSLYDYTRSPESVASLKNGTDIFVPIYNKTAGIHTGVSFNYNFGTDTWTNLSNPNDTNSTYKKAGVLNTNTVITQGWDEDGRVQILNWDSLNQEWDVDAGSPPVSIEGSLKSTVLSTVSYKDTTVGSLKNFGAESVSENLSNNVICVLRPDYAGNMILHTYGYDEPSKRMVKVAKDFSFFEPVGEILGVSNHDYIKLSAINGNNIVLSYIVSFGSLYAAKIIKLAYNRVDSNWIKVGATTTIQLGSSIDDAKIGLLALNDTDILVSTKVGSVYSTDIHRFNYIDGVYEHLTQALDSAATVEVATAMCKLDDDHIVICRRSSDIIGESSLNLVVYNLKYT